MSQSITYMIELIELQKTPYGEEVGTRGLVTSSDIDEILKLSKVLGGAYGEKVGCFRIKDSNNNYLTPKQYKDFMRQVFI